MYLLIEEIMNGTVTLEIISTGIEAEDYYEAIKKVMRLPNFETATIQVENDRELRYFIPGKLPCYGRVENKVLRVI